MLLSDLQLGAFVLALLLQLIIVLCSYRKSSLEELLGDAINYRGVSTADVIAEANRKKYIVLEKKLLSGKVLNNSNSLRTIDTIWKLKDSSARNNILISFAMGLSNLIKILLVTVSYILIITAFALSEVKLLDLALILYFSALIPMWLNIAVKFAINIQVMNVIKKLEVIYADDLDIFNQYLFFNSLSELNSYIYPVKLLWMFINPFRTSK